MTVTWLSSDFPGPLLPRGSILQGRVGIQPATALLTLCGRIEFGLVYKGGQVRGLWEVLFVSLQVHRHACPLLIGDRQLLLVCRVDHCGDDWWCLWCRGGSRVLQGKAKQSLLSSRVWVYNCACAESGAPLPWTGPAQIPPPASPTVCSDFAPATPQGNTFFLLQISLSDVYFKEWLWIKTHTHAGCRVLVF